MIALDSSVLIAFLNGEKGKDIDRLAQLIALHEVTLPPPVVVEVLSNHATRHLILPTILKMSLLTLHEGFWLRASELRARILSHGHKAKMADTLIAQSCIDHDLPLLTRDTDFRHYAKFGSLKLV